MSILVAGSLHLDVILNAPHLPTLDETVSGNNVSYVFGGKGGNQALSAARMGVEVHFAGRAGGDGFGNMLRHRLEASTLDISQLQRDPGPSGMSAAIVNDEGNYGAVIVSAANLNIDADAITLPQDCSILLLQNEIPEAVNLALAQNAKACGARVWLNAAPARPLGDAFLALIDLMIVNRVEAAFYADQMASVDVLLTLGEDGVSYRGQTYSGFDVDVVSTHGAGDAFVGALAAEAAQGRHIAAGIQFAQAAAALQVSLGLSDREHVNRKAVEAFIEDYESR